MAKRTESDLRAFFLFALAAAEAGAAAIAAGSKKPVRPAPCQPSPERQQAAERRAAEARQAWEMAREIVAQIAAGTADPQADAAAAAGRGEFGLMATLRDRGGAVRAPGLICFTPGGAPPRVRALRVYGCVIDAEVRAWGDYATAYNQVLVARDDYPDRDLCRPAAPEEWRPSRGEQPATMAARPVTGPPRSLHEAARRGTAADIRRLLRTDAVDALDGLEMTALAWAVARDNGPAAEVLLAAGADPWAGPAQKGGWPVYLAAALGREGWFARLAALPGRPFARWSRLQLRAAASGGNAAILTRMLSEPHEPPGIEMLPGPLPPVALAEMLLRDNPAAATPLLRRASDRESRPDLAQLALAHGADANAPSPNAGIETPLGSAASGTWPNSLEIVDLLLGAGADPNALSWRTRPLWIAAGTMRLGQREGGELAPRALAIFERLRAGGADINLPDYQGRPPIWALLFPRARAPRDLDASFLTPRLLEMLVRAGLALNAEWEGDRMLTEVERQAGRESELAVTLRRLGASH
jgi:hypothetical protein